MVPADAVRRGRAARIAVAAVEFRPLGPLEILVATTLLVALALAVFSSHILDGGFIMDDWSNAAKTRYLAACCGVGVTGSDPSFLGEVRNMLSDGPAGYHLGLTVIAPLTHHVLGESQGLHLALAAGLGALMSAAFYVVVRVLGLERLPAAAIAALVLLFPFSDSTRLWPMASFNQIAVVLWLAGVVVAFAGLRQVSARRAVLLHGAALVLYAAGMLVYELVAGGVILSVALYLLRGARPRQALVRWVADGLVTAVTLYIAVTEALPRPILSWGDRFRHGGSIVEESFTLLAFVFVPLGTPSRWLVGGVVLAIVVLAVLRRRRLPGDGVERAALTRWLQRAAAGVVAVGAGYLLIVPSIYGSPLDLGIENRTNMLAAFGWAALVYAVAMLAGLLLCGGTGRSLRLASLVPLAVCLLVGTGYVVRLADSISDYDRSATERVKVLEAVADARPFRPGSTIYTFGHPTYVAEGVPVFTWIWDQSPAVKLTLKDPSFGSFPSMPGTTITCTPTRVWPNSPYGFGELQAARYGEAYFVDTERRVSTRIDDQASCRRAAAEYRAGPLARDRPDCALEGGGVASRLRWRCAGKVSEGV